MSVIASSSSSGIADEPDDRHQRDQRREQRQQPVVGQRRRPVGHVVLAELRDRPLDRREQRRSCRSVPAARSPPADCAAALREVRVRHRLAQARASPSVSMRSLRTVSETVALVGDASPVLEADALLGDDALLDHRAPRRAARPRAPPRRSPGRPARRSTFASVIGSRSTRTSSRLYRHGLLVTSSVTTYLRSRARPASRSRGADAQLLLRARHRLVGRRAGRRRRSPPRGPASVVRRVPPPCRLESRGVYEP